MPKASDILGMNAREGLYRKFNPMKARKYAYSKLAAKKVLEKNGILVPELYAQFESMDEVREFHFAEIKTSFVIKPVGGNAGKGILIVRKKKGEEGRWLSSDGRTLDVSDLVLHIGDILEGQYSTYGSSHKAFVEEWISTHPRFKKYTFKGTPDVRVVVYNKVPVMAMLRLPTEESQGKANLHQGAIGVGIDLSSGVTLGGVRKNKLIKYLPGKKRKLNGIRIPKWKGVLTTAVKAAEVAGLVYCGVDVFVHVDKGPMVVELNSNPGLTVQLANRAGLKKRLERVAGLTIRDAEHGVRVGRALFAEWFADKVASEDGLVIIDTFEKIKVRSRKEKKWVEVDGKVDTGAFRSAIDKDLATELGLLGEDNVLWEGRFRHSYGRERRPVVDVRLRIKGRKVNTAVSVANRSKMRAKVLIGRRDLQGFLINPQLRKELS